MQTRQRGFTLIEVLVALMLMALVSLISWRALDSVERASDRLGQASDDIMDIMRVMGQMERDISLHADDNVLPQYQAAAQTSTQTMPAGIDYVRSESGNAYLQIVRAAAADNGTWQQVRWWQDGNTLRRAIAVASKVLPLPEPEQANGATVLDGIERFTIKAWVPGRGWTDLPTADNLPQATGIEITLDRRKNGRAERYRKVVLLP